MTQNAFSLLWVTGKLDFRKVARNSLIHALYEDFDLRSASLTFSGHTKKNTFSPLCVTEKLGFMKAALKCSSNQFYGDFHPCSTFCRFGPVRRRTHFVYYRSLERSIFQKVLGTAEITCLIMTLMSVVHFVSFGAVST